MKINDYPYVVDFIKESSVGLLTIKSMNTTNEQPLFDEHGCLICGVQGGHIRFSVTDILGSLLVDSQLFDLIENTRKRTDRFVFAQKELLEYFDGGEYSILRLEYILGRYGASYPIVAANGNTRYCCNDIVQVVFSIVHYCISEGYQFGKCAHCGKWFARKTKKIEYCNGHSPVILGSKNYTHLHCADAVKNIRQQLRRMRQQIRENYSMCGDLDSPSQYASVFEEQFGSKYCIRGMKNAKDFLDCYIFLDEELLLSAGGN